MTAAMTSLGFDGFVSGIATVIAEHMVPGSAPAPAHDAAPQAAPPVVASVPAVAFLLDHEKVVWHYPDTASRILEELP